MSKGTGTSTPGKTSGGAGTSDDIEYIDLNREDEYLRAVELEYLPDKPLIVEACKSYLQDKRKIFEWDGTDATYGNLRTWLSVHLVHYHIKLEVLDKWDKSTAVPIMKVQDGVLYGVLNSLLMRTEHYHCVSRCTSGIVAYTLLNMGTNFHTLGSLNTAKHAFLQVIQRFPSNPNDWNTYRNKVLNAVQSLSSLYSSKQELEEYMISQLLSHVPEIDALKNIALKHLSGPIGNLTFMSVLGEFTTAMQAMKSLITTKETLLFSGHGTHHSNSSLQSTENVANDRIELLMVKIDKMGQELASMKRTPRQGPTYATSSDYKVSPVLPGQCLRCGDDHTTVSCKLRHLNIKCKRCNRFGHVQKLCRSNTPCASWKQIAPTDDRTTGWAAQVEELLNSIRQISSNYCLFNLNTTVLDSGASKSSVNHISKLKPDSIQDAHSIVTGVNGDFKTTEQGIHAIQPLNNLGESPVIEFDSTVINSLPVDIVSADQLVEQNYEINLRKVGSNITHSDKPDIEIPIHREGGVFVIPTVKSHDSQQLTLQNQTTCFAAITSEIAHARLNHRPFDTLNQLSKLDNVRFTLQDSPLQRAAEGACMGCVLGHQRQKRTSKARHGAYATKPGTHLFLDSTGIKDPSYVGNRYAFSMSDAYSGDSEIYFTKNKQSSSSEQVVIQFVNEWYGPNGPPAGVTLHVDGAGELVHGELEKLVAEYRWKIHIAPPEEHALFGFAERRIGIAMDGARTLLHACNLSNRFWDFAAEQFNYVHNRLESSTGMPAPRSRAGFADLDLNLVRTFGCLVAFHDHKATKKDFAPKSRLGINLGLDKSFSYGVYSIFDLETKKIRHSRSVDFFETIFPNESDDPWTYMEKLKQLPRPAAPSTFKVRENFFQPLIKIISKDEKSQFDEDNEEWETEQGSDLPDTASSSTTNSGISSRITPVISSATSTASFKLPVSHTAPIAPKPIPTTESIVKTTTGSVPHHGTIPSLMRLPTQHLKTSTPALHKEMNALTASQTIRNMLSDTTTPTTRFNVKEVVHSIKEVEEGNNSDDTSKVKEVSENVNLFQGTKPFVKPRQIDHEKLLLSALENIEVTEEEHHIYDDPLHPVEIPKTITGLKKLSPRDRIKWTLALRTEMDGFEQKQVLQEVTFAQMRGAKPVRVKTVFCIKDPDELGRKRLRVRVVACGNEEVRDIDSKTWHAPTVMPAAIKAMIIKGLHDGSTFHTIDISQAFLFHAIYDRDYYIMMLDEEGKMRYYRCLKALYGWTDSPGRWYETFSTEFEAVGYRSCLYNKSLFTNSERHTNVGVHVDDCLIVSPSKPDDIFDHFKEVFGEENVKIRCIDNSTSKLLGLTLTIDNKKKICQISQEDSINDLLTANGMLDCKPTYTPAPPNTYLPSHNEESSHPMYASNIGSLNWIALGSRIDIMHAVSELARHTQKNGAIHGEFLKHLLRYLKATRDYKLTLRGDKPLVFRSWGDASYAECKETRKSKSGYLLTLGGSVLLAKSKLQPTVAVSSCEAELYTQFETMLTTEHMQYILHFLGIPDIMTKPTDVLTDSQSAIKLIEKVSPDRRSKHLDVRYFRLQQSVNDKRINQVYEPTGTMVADILTKSLGRRRHEFLTRAIMNGEVQPGLEEVCLGMPREALELAGAIKLSRNGDRNVQGEVHAETSGDSEEGIF